MQYAPILSEVEQAIALGSTERRRDMLLQVADFFVAGSNRFSDGEVELFDEILTRLIAEIEASARVILARRLAPVPNAPRIVSQILATDDEIRVAYPILIQSERLDEDTLIRTAQTKTQQHLLAISRRKSLSEPVTDVLIERGDDQVVLSIVRNKGARFSANGYSLLVERVDGNDTLAESFGMRPDVPHVIFLRLLEKASDVVRRKLIHERPDAKAEIEHALAAATDEIRRVFGEKSASYADAQAQIRSLYEAGKLDDKAVRDFAEGKMFEQTTACLAQLCGVPPSIVAHAIAQHHSETLIVLARAAKLSWTTTKALLSFHAEHRRRPLQKIDQCLASFERLKPETAKQIIEFYRMPQEKRDRRPRGLTRRQ
jgi:uncharacterized protein (DUF2336 family)